MKSARRFFLLGVLCISVGILRADDSVAPKNDESTSSAKVSETPPPPPSAAVDAPPKVAPPSTEKAPPFKAAEDEQAKADREAREEARAELAQAQAMADATIAQQNSSTASEPSAIAAPGNNPVSYGSNSYIHHSMQELFQGTPSNSHSMSELF